MRKWLLILTGIALISAVVLVARYDQNYNASREGYEIECVQPSQPPGAAASLTCKIYSGQNTAHDQSRPPWWQKLMAWPEGITAWLLLFTLAAICWQSVAMAESAKAAFVQIQMMKQKERARLEVQSFKDEFAGNDAAEEIDWIVKISIKNFGSTWAFNLNCEATAIWKGPDNAIVQDRLYPRISDSRIVESEKTVSFLVWPNADRLDVFLEEYREFNLRGRITYQDVFGDRHETPFDVLWITRSKRDDRTVEDFFWESTDAVKPESEKQNSQPYFTN